MHLFTLPVYLMLTTFVFPRNQLMYLSTITGGCECRVSYKYFGGKRVAR